MQLLKSTIVFFLLAQFLNAQNQVTLRLSSPYQVAESSCYRIDMRTEDHKTIALAGQNYRLYYDADNLHFRPELTQSALDKTAYSELDIQHSEKSGYGIVSISVDAMQRNDKSVIVNNKWINTIGICFDGKQQKSGDLIWADPKLTQQLATVELVLTEWTVSNRQEVLEIQDYQHQDTEPSELASEAVSVFPNPSSGHFEYSLNKEIERTEQLTIHDILGRTVFQENLSIGTVSGTIDISNLPDGSYFVQVLDQPRIQVIKSD